jgi:hypothetical protein
MEKVKSLFNQHYLDRDFDDSILKVQTEEEEIEREAMKEYEI